MKKIRSDHILDKTIDELKRIRLEKGLSHESLSALCGLNRSTISLIENKKRVPTLLTCLKISHALEVSLAEIVKQFEEEYK